MSRLLVFQHVAAEPLGTLDPLIRRRGHRIRFTNFERHPDVQPNVDRYRGLIVLGGPMNVEDSAHRAHLLTEMRAIERMLVQGKPVLGICLGAQLLAHVLGAPVQRHHQPEIGWYPLHTTAAGQADPVLAPLGPGTPVFQWHRYSFDVPQGATHLARTDSCEPQAFRYGDNAYGFQFHLEMDERLIDRWLANPGYRAELAELAGLEPGHASDEQTIRARTGKHIMAMQAQADAVFNGFLDLVGCPQRRYTLPSREWV
ncbi:type 1 glutamine amidotransferase [Lysobacter cavernae]|uniref:Type 1 glutamine amidotransferase n=1 Tax=Lysobacter cavernae TaxID=1685901 RepID=A0ABV7RUX5_9GAMM